MHTLILLVIISLCASAYADIFDFEVLNAEGETVPLSNYRSAKAILIGA